MKTILTLLLFSSLVLSFGQDTLTVFYDIYGEKVEKEDTNGYFLQLWKLDENTWGSICHYKTGRKVEVQYYSSEAKKRKGDFVSYYENGNVDELGKYKDSLRTGTWLSYYKSGQLSDSTVYKFDNKNGTYHHFYKSGQLKDYGTYSDGKKNSDWLFYFENGKLSGKIKYQNDEAISVEYWDESGVAQVDNLVPEITPEFPGGNYAMMQFIMANFQYHEFAREEN